MALVQGIGNAASGAAAGATVGGPIGAAVGGLAGLISGLFSSDGSDEAKAALAKNQQIWDSLKIPDIDKALLLQTYQQNGTITPELIKQLPLQEDTKNILNENPENRGNEQMAMNTLKQLSQSGMSAQDVAQMNDLRSKVAGDTEAKTQQLLQDEAQRGQTGSGNTLAAQLAAVQGGSQTASKGAIDVAANAANARQNALKGFADLASQVRQQDVGTQKFNTENEIARQRFLDQNSLGRQQANVQAINNANLLNLQRQQQVADTNTAAANNELNRQANAKQTMFQDQYAKAHGQTAGNTAAANLATNQAANQAQGMSNMWSGIGQAATALKGAGIFGGTPDTSNELKLGEGETKSGNYEAPAGPQMPSSFEFNPQPLKANTNSTYAHGGRVEKPNPIEHQHAKNLGKILDILKQRETQAFSSGGKVQSENGTYSEGGRYDASGNNTFGSNAYADGGRVDRGPAMDTAATKASDAEYARKYAPAPGGLLDTIQTGISGLADKMHGKACGGRMESNPLESLVKTSMKYKKGGRIPGEDKVDRDDPVNDTVNAKLSPKEIVVPVSHAKSPDKAKEFIDKLFKTESKEKSSKKEDLDHKALLQVMTKLHSGK